MKHFTILIFLLLSLLATSQPTYFNKIIDPQPFNGANNVISMIKRDSLIYVFGGNLPDTGWIQNNSLLQFNLSGQLLNKTLILHTK
jgi:cell division protein YceG involved in septum cleavage